MRKKNFLIILILVIAASITFISCDLVSKSSEEIVGTWTGSDSLYDWIFNADNSFTSDFYGLGIRINTGTWSLTKDLLTLDYDNEYIETEQYDVRFSDGNMYWELPDTGITLYMYSME